MSYFFPPLNNARADWLYYYLHVILSGVFFIPHRNVSFQTTHSEQYILFAQSNGSDRIICAIPMRHTLFKSTLNPESESQLLNELPHLGSELGGPKRATTREYDQ
jgi:hypothetical protein